MNSSPLYRTWHNNRPLSQVVHWSVLVWVAVALASNILGAPSSQSQLALVQGSTSPLASRSIPIPGSYIVTFTDETSDIPGLAKALATQAGAHINFTYTAALKGVALSNVPLQALDGLRHNPRVKMVEQDQTVNVEGIETLDPANNQWDLDRIDQRVPATPGFADTDFDHLYHYNTTASNVSAYIIDTGIRASHTDFGGRVVGGYNAVNSDSVYTDCPNSFGHGTGVAGILGGSKYGVAKEVKLYSVRVVDCNTGSASWSAVIAGMDWVAKNAVHPAVVNISLGGGKNSTLNSALGNLVNSGVVVVVAAGNYNADACNYSPASAPSALTVAATAQNTTNWMYDYKFSSSNYGPCIDIAAPGAAIKTDTNYSDTDDSGAVSGTSDSAPQVAGVAALYLSSHPTATPAEVSQAILSSATPNVLYNFPAGTPNLLLYSLFDSTTNPPPPPAPLPTVSVSLNPTSITSGQTSILGWSSTNATSCTGDNNLGTLSISGSTTVAPLQTTTYTISCIGAGGSASQSATLTVSSVTPPPPPTISFNLGDSVHTTTKLNVRSNPGGKRIGSQSTGASGVITAGPSTAQSYTWWYVDFATGVDGWVAQDYLSK